ncbi:MAG: hypothetical protein JSS90_03385 [Bacteroidetes bacterium]|jgi:hypothetical protein|nr:hypothetical protein [Bacteroidota bacterium]
MRTIILILCTTLVLNSGAQPTEQKNSQKKSNHLKNQNTMDLSKLTNPNVKQAIEALQSNDLKSWYSYFTADAVFTDDGNTMNFKSFFDNAFNHKEKFLTIDKVENQGKEITGNFYAGQWGTFKVFFKFQLNAEGKIKRLDIGQVH